jgi:hypothetical protein
MKAGETIQDVLVFRPTPPRIGLDLDLPLWNSVEKFRFHIPADFIQQIP